MAPRRLGIAAAAFLTAGTAAAGEIPSGEKRSGSEFMAPETRAMQADDMSNPGMLWVLEGERLWGTPPGGGGASCGGCHSEASASMRGVAARYPAFDEKSKRPVDLEARINLCRRDHQGAEPLARESEELLSLAAYVTHQSRGMPIEASSDARLTPFRENGKRLFESRIGQLDLSCSSCHDNNWRARLGGSPITQAHPTAYPLYRLEWQSLGSLQRRMRNCMIGVRAEPYAPGSPEMTDLEVYLKSRAAPLPIETPGVRP